MGRGRMVKRAAPAEAAVLHRDGHHLHVVDTFKPNRKQVEFFRACNTPGIEEILFHGSIRAGKSQAAGKLLCAWAMRYGGTYLAMRATKQELEDSTKKIMLQGEGGIPPSIPPRLIAAKNQQFNYVRLINNAEIHFRSLEPDERGKIRNITYAAGFIDQAEEFDGEGVEDYYDELIGRLSDPYGPRKMVLVANPGPESHWLVKRFGLTDETRDDAPPHRRHVHVTLYDNLENLHPDYVRSRLATEETNPDYFKRMILGQWGVVGGLRFKNFNERLSVVDQAPFDTLDPDWFLYEGADWGFTNDTAWVWVATDYQGAHWVLGEHVKSGWTVAAHAARILELRQNEQQTFGFGGTLEPSATWLDPSAWNRQRKEVSSVADSFREHGIYPARAQNERIGGWARMHDHLTTTMPDGYSRLRFLRGACPTTLKQVKGLRIKPGTEDVEKVNDHCADALRYVLMSRVPAATEQLGEPVDMSREGLVKRLQQRKQDLMEGKNIVVPFPH